MDTSEEYIKVVIVHPTVHFFFSFVNVMHLNVASYLYGKQIKSNMCNKLYLRMIFICVRFNWLDLHDCHSMLLKTRIVCHRLMKFRINKNQLSVTMHTQYEIMFLNVD